MSMDAFRFHDLWLKPYEQPAFGNGKHPFLWDDVFRA